jgi:hypothetical protein
MDWFAQLALQRDKADADDVALRVKSGALWNGVKLMLAASRDVYVAHYPSKPNGIVVEYDDAHGEQPYILTRRLDAQSAPQKEIARVTVTLNAGGFSAAYSSGSAAAAFTFGRDNEGYAQILFKEKPVCLDRVADIILRPLFFPDLPG